MIFCWKCYALPPAARPCEMCAKEKRDAHIRTSLQQTYGNVDLDRLRYLEELRLQWIQEWGKETPPENTGRFYLSISIQPMKTTTRDFYLETAARKINDLEIQVRFLKKRLSNIDLEQALTKLEMLRSQGVKI